jgi:hypothetical protein
MKRQSIPTHVHAPGVSTELGPLLIAVYEELYRAPVDRALLRAALENLLVYLSSPAGGTGPNCQATDLFFCLQEGWEEGRPSPPAGFEEILHDLGGALHDTLRYPQIAEDAESTPAHLLRRLRELPVEDS